MNHTNTTTRQRTPRADIIIRIETSSYLQHYHEQGGTIQTMAALVKDDAIHALHEMDLVSVCERIVTTQGKDDVITSVGIQDEYVWQETDESDESDEPDEPEAPKNPAGTPAEALFSKLGFKLLADRHPAV